MPGQGDVYTPTGEDAYRDFTCGWCGIASQALVVASCEYTDWMLCPRDSCGKGSVIVGGKPMSPRHTFIASQHPSSLPGNAVDGLTDDVADAYKEARECLSVGAATACELMCRKILMHVAVDKAGAESGKPFASYVDDIENAGYTTPPMKPWVDMIRKNANEATHGLDKVGLERADSTLAFTEQLLRLVYEMDYLAQSFLPDPSQ